MGLSRKTIGGAVIAALLATSATPAFARGPYAGSGWGSSHGGGYGHGRWHRNRDNFDLGDALVGAAVVGVLAAILTSSKNKKTASTANRGNINSEDAAVDACATATERQAGNGSSVNDITQVDKNADGWDVEGLIEQRYSGREGGEGHRFTCSVRYGAVEHIYIDEQSAALN